MKSNFSWLTLKRRHRAGDLTVLLEYYTHFRDKLSNVSEHFHFDKAITCKLIFKAFFEYWLTEDSFSTYAHSYYAISRVYLEDMRLVKRNGIPVEGEWWEKLPPIDDHSPEAIAEQLRGISSEMDGNLQVIKAVLGGRYYRNATVADLAVKLKITVGEVTTYAKFGRLIGSLLWAYANCPVGV